MNRLILTCMAAAVLCFSATTSADAGCHDPAPSCCPAPPACCPPPAPVCCPPPPVSVSWCVVDPCTGCSYEVSACVPACCANEVPCLAGWRHGWFGRKVLTYKWPGCDHCVDVVVTKHGRTIVRG